MSLRTQKEYWRNQRNQKYNRNYTDHSIIKISKNTEPSPGNLWWLAVTQTSVTDHWTKLAWKLHKKQGERMITASRNNNNSSTSERKITRKQLSLCRTAITDLSLSTSVFIVHRSWEIFKAISCIDTELLNIGSSWSSYLCSVMWRGPQEYVVYEFAFTSPAVSRMSGSSNLDSFCDGW